MKNYEQYDNIYDTSSGVSILIWKKKFPNVKINVCLSSIANSAILLKIVSICLLYISLHDPINEKVKYFTLLF